MSQMLNVRIPDDLYSRIDQIAATERATRTDVVVNLLSGALDSRQARLTALADRVLAERSELFARLA